MTTRMKRTPHAGNAEGSAQFLKISKKISLRKLRALESAEEKRMVVLGEIPVKDLAQLNAHWYESVLVALSFDPKREILEVNIIAKQTEQLLHSEPSIERGKDDGVEPRIRTPDGLPVYKPLDLLRRKRA